MTAASPKCLQLEVARDVVSLSQKALSHNTAANGETVRCLSAAILCLIYEGKVSDNDETALHQLLPWQELIVESQSSESK